jgi:hypothetical protein
MEKVKKDSKDAKIAQKREAKERKNKEKVSLLKAANKTEERVKSTLNSGRINKDADLKTSELSIDVKMQSTRKDPVISVDEFDKVNNDCLRSNRRYGILCIVNKDGRAFYVIGEELFKEKFL